jgi:hypothetical protein
MLTFKQHTPIRGASQPQMLPGYLVRFVALACHREPARAECLAVYCVPLSWIFYIDRKEPRSLSPIRILGCAPRDSIGSTADCPLRCREIHIKALGTTKL